jgi:TRAP-type mannitol/chloroaromatic compound transport system permease small subunit
VQKALEQIATRIESVIDLFGKVASWLTLSIVLLIVINVVLRYSMSLGIGCHDFIWYELCLTPWGQCTG